MQLDARSLFASVNQLPNSSCKRNCLPVEAIESIKTCTDSYSLARSSSSLRFVSSRATYSPAPLPLDGGEIAIIQHAGLVSRAPPSATRRASKCPNVARLAANDSAGCERFATLSTNAVISPIVPGTLKSSFGNSGIWATDLEPTATSVSISGKSRA